jgi:uncharacterized delta-60 repeat protein
MKQLTHTRWPASERLPSVLAFAASLLLIADVSAHPGSIDSTFNSTALLAPVPQRGRVLALAVQPDQRIVAGGEFVTAGSLSLRNLARLNPDGTLDSTFNPGGGPNDRVTSIDLQPDGKVLIAGWFTEVNGSPRHGAARLNADGTLDASFDPGTGPDSPGSAASLVRVQPDGQVLVAGTFTSFAGTPHTNLVRLSAQGDVDASFSVRLGTQYTDFDGITAMELLPDGRIYVTGPASPVVPTLYGLARLLPDGAVDATYAPPALIGYAMALQPDGKLVVGGTWSEAVTRVNPDGSIDETFGTFLLPGGDVWVHVITLQPDGRLLIAGDNFDESGTPGIRHGEAMVRVNPDGSLDSTFSAGISVGAVGNVVSIALQADGKILTGTGEATEPPLLLRLNNEVITGIEFTSTSFLVSEAGGFADITLRRTGPVDRPALVRVDIEDGTARAGLDYSTRVSSVRFRAGESTASFRIFIRQDDLAEGDETVELSLTGPKRGTLALRTHALLIIRDDDGG